MNLPRILTCVALCYPALVWAESASKPELVMQTGHSSYVSFAEDSPDGKLLVSGSGTETILWDTATGLQLRRFSPDDPGTSEIKFAAFSPDSRVLITNAGYHLVKARDLVSGADLWTIDKEKKDIADIVTAVDAGFKLLAVAADGLVDVADVDTGRTLRTLRTQTADSRVNAMIFSGSKLVVGGSEGPEVWNAETGVLERRLEGVKNVGWLALSPDGNLLAAVGGSAEAYSITATAGVWDLRTGRRVATLEGDPRSEYGVKLGFTSDGAAVVGCEQISEGQRGHTLARLWGAADGKELRRFQSATNDVYRACAISKSGGLLAIQEGNDIQLWDDTTGNTTLLAGHTGFIGGLDFSRDDKRLYSESADKTVRAWDVPSGRQAQIFRGRVGSVQLAGSADGKILAAAVGPLAFLWDRGQGTLTKVLRGHTDTILSLALTPDGKYLVTGGLDHTARLWDVKDGKQLGLFQAQDAVRAVAIDDDAKRLATAGTDKTRVWKVSSGQELYELDPSWQAAFAGGGKYLITDRTTQNSVGIMGVQTLVISKASNGEEIRTIGFPEKNFEGPRFKVSPDGKLLGVDNSEMSILKIPSGEPVIAGDKHEFFGFLPDGEAYAWSRGDADHGMVSLMDPENGRVLKSFSFPEASGGRYWYLAPDAKLAMFGRDDGYISVIDLSSGRHLADWFSLEDGGIVLSPEGYFDGSPEALKEIRWTVGMQSFPLEAFSENYYVPGLWPRLLSGEAVAPQGGKSISQGFALPPSVKITSPNNGEMSANDSVDVTVKATDQGGGVDEIRLFQNGKAIGEETRDIKVKPKGDVYSQTFHVTLVDGDNVFKALALSKDRIEGNPDQITVTYKGPEKQASLHVLVVGINEYKNSDLNLNYAQPDAKAIDDFFGAGPDKLFAATTKKELFDAQATKAGILAELTALKATPPQDVVLIYLAGHGESIDNTWYFVPYDLVYPEQDEQVKAKGLSSDELKDAVRGMGAQKVLLMMDACKSGGALLAFAGRGVEDRKALSMLARATGVHVVAASTKDQLAAEVKQLGHGVFTYTLLEGLKGGAAKNGVVTVRELLAYIEDELPEVSLKYKSQAQYPVVDSRGMDFPITSAK